MLVPLESIGYYVQNRYEEGADAKMHNIYFQFLAILKRLVDHGFVVDCIKKDTLEYGVDTSQYELILDEGDSLAFMPKVEGQRKVFYCTGTKWNRWNSDELRRVEWFQQKYGIFVKPVRQIKPNFSDQVADYILYKGVPEQMQDFNKSACRVQLAMPVEFEPDKVVRDFSKRDFVWIGGWGAIHKGLDLVVEAFEKLPGLKLHVFGAIEREPPVMNWLQEKIAANPNIRYHGFADYRSPAFQQIVASCAGHVYPSAGENGCATLGQTAHFGQVPITTPTANNQANYLGLNIEEADRESMINSICANVDEVVMMSEKELKERSFELMGFARQRFTRTAFIQSFDQFLLNSKFPVKC
ncbi:hypothetical protein GCM10023185_21880 [Hymenobacter saemangeumensis]|uniref:Glycosyltransferase n=2 Tax=Hymenobacter saemangeumensis TaxID=1084522 RepID=A0ABP8IEL8_9BACT